MSRRTPVTLAYGPHPRQVVDLYVPHSADRAPVAVLLHGGYWRARYDRSLEAAVAEDLVDDGWAVWNVEYRGVGDGGGWPATFTDVAAAVDLLADVAREHGLGTEVVAAVGHSAGGTLALWSAGRRGLAPGTPGSSPRCVPTAVVAQAAICDLATGARGGLGGGAVVDLMGSGPDAPGSAYPLASPAGLLPLRVPLLVVTGDADDDVPSSQSTAFAAAATRAGDDVTLVVERGVGHYDHLDPRSTVWRTTRTWLDSHAAGPARPTRPGPDPGSPRRGGG